MRKYDVYGIGSALMDLIIEASPDLLEELNLKKGQMQLIDNIQSKVILEKIKLIDMKEIPGGSAANTIAGINSLGGKVVFCGKVGDDKPGELYVKKMVEEGVGSNIKKDQEATGHAITFITPDTERTFATFLGAAIDLKKEDINKDELANSKILHIEGYALEGNNKESALHAIQIAKENDVKISIDLGDPGLVERNLEELKEIVKGSYILFANEEEAKAFTGKEGEEALNELSKYCEIAIVKFGPEGSSIKQGDNTYKVKGVKVDAVDTTGAGDIYAACILYGITNNLNLDKSGELASFTAAKVVEQLGARLLSYGKVFEKLNSLKE
jgi:sugar/nucleoside kinase (ribokinase family)